MNLNVRLKDFYRIFREPRIIFEREGDSFKVVKQVGRDRKVDCSVFVRRYEDGFAAFMDFNDNDPYLLHDCSTREEALECAYVSAVSYGSTWAEKSKLPFIDRTRPRRILSLKCLARFYNLLASDIAEGV